MRHIATLLLLLVLSPNSAAAQEVTYDFQVEEVELAPPVGGSDRLAVPDRSPSPSKGRFRSTYGPFRVLDATHASMTGVTDERSPAAFAAMTRDHPGIAMLEMVDCPGTEDDTANLLIGRSMPRKSPRTFPGAAGWPRERSNCFLPAASAPPNPAPGLPSMRGRTIPVADHTTIRRMHP